MGGFGLTAAVPVLVLMALGAWARRRGLLGQGDERVLNAYVYFFALPALFFSELAVSPLSLDTARFVLAGNLPVLGLAALVALGGRAFGLSADRRRLWLLGTVFGSLAFFGIPYLDLATGDPETVRLASLGAATVAPIGVALVLAVLERHRAPDLPAGRAARTLLMRLGRNPLMLSILAGIAWSLADLPLPVLATRSLQLLGRSTAPVALFTLGVYLAGREPAAWVRALPLSVLRLVLLPGLTLAVAWALGLGCREQVVLVVLNGTPIAVNLVVLSARYGFFQDEIASLALVSSVLAVGSLGGWFWIAGSCLP